MNDYLQIYDSPNYGRAFIVRLCGKILATVLIVASLLLIFDDNVTTGGKIAGIAIGIAGLIVGWFAFLTSYICPKCGQNMKIRRGDRKFWGTPLLLTCDRCKCYIDLKTSEE